MKHMIAEYGIDHMADGDGQGQDGNVPGSDAPTARLPGAVGRLILHQAASAAITSADCTTSACRGKMRPVRKSWTSSSESEQQSSTTNRL